MLLIIESLLSGDFASLRFHLAIVAIMWLIVAIAIILDLASGWRKAKERNEARTSYGLRRTVTKTVLYYAMMLFAFMFDCIGMFFYPQPYVTLIAAAFLIFIEGKSILEKAHEKDRYKLNENLKSFGHILENRDDLLKGIADIVKEQLKEKEKIQNEEDR
ncbi:phage holin family protein [Dysgonomonas sp. BGC7]|uniref:phage holin family protein n=1 Tax=Dysgonomonas sp. BGC7 TaxID=1658008 RepID=UPI000683268E|nr:phage holin family protein [Dysgonomonas sp. BGC7]MBD8388206.1 phage holin family protein [Dysgonomonas sp. BGC7]